MRINKVTAINSQSKQREIFVFGDATSGKPLLPCENLCSYLDFCFKNANIAPAYVEVDYFLNETEFLLSKLQGRDGITHASLKQKQNEQWQTIARDEEALKRVQSDLQLSFSALPVCITAQTVEDFHGNLSEVSQLKSYLEAEREIAKVSADTRAQKEDAARKLREFSQKSVENVSHERLAQAQSEVDEVSKQLALATQKLNCITSSRADGGIRTAIEQKLQIAQRRYDKLLSFSEQADAARRQAEQTSTLSDNATAQHSSDNSIAERMLDGTTAERLQELAEQCYEYETKCCELTSELEWKEQELADIVSQYDERQLQFALLQDKRSSMETVKGELDYITSLSSQNEQLSQLLTKLFEKQRQFESDKKTCLNKLSSLEKSLNETRDGLEAFQVSTQTASEVMEAVRVDAQIDEVNAQLEKIQTELTVKESQIAEKEGRLAVQKKRFRSVADLDVAVSPIKAKDTILQVLDTKYSKLEAINVSLAEKQRNLERALDDYKYKILQLEDSRTKLTAQRDKALLRKQEEFKREVLLNSQKTFRKDSTSVFAATTSFQDAEIQTLEQEIVDRNADRDLLVQRAAQLDGAIKEIKRHKEINAAEMETLRGEKENINNRYNEIVSQNNSDAVFNYLKALNNDSSTKYLLDMQQDAVRLDAEVAELRHYTDSLKEKASGLKYRLNNLKGQSQEDLPSNVSETVVSNDQVKDKLTDIGEKIAANCDMYIAECKRFEELNTKLQSINSAITEATRTVKVNQAQIKKSTEKAQKLAGEEDLAHAVQNFNYDLSDIESELQMLAESKQALIEEVFSKRLELEKMQWLCSEKRREHDLLAENLPAETSVDGANVEENVAENAEVSEVALESTDTLEIGEENTVVSETLAESADVPDNAIERDEVSESACGSAEVSDAVVEDPDMAKAVIESVEAPQTVAESGEAAENDVEYAAETANEEILESAEAAAGEKCENAAEESASDMLEEDLPNAEVLRKKVRKYDNLKARLAEKVHNYQAVLKNFPQETTDEALAEQQKLVDELSRRQSQAESTRRELTEKFVAASIAKMKVTAAAAQVGVLSSLQQTMKHMDMASLLFADKISALLSIAANEASSLLNQKIRLWANDGKLRISTADGTFDYDELPLSTKTAVYTSLILSSNSLDEKCLVFDQSVQSQNDQRFQETLAQTDGVRFVVDARFDTL